MRPYVALLLCKESKEPAAAPEPSLATAAADRTVRLRTVVLPITHRVLISIVRA